MNPTITSPAPRLPEKVCQPAHPSGAATARTLTKAAHGLWLIAYCLLSIVYCSSCANPGSGPDGGPFDETPPRILSMSPRIGATGITPRRIEIHFDENVKVENAAEKVVVSPPSPEPPEVSVSGKRIRVTLPDTLRPATTYTIDFSDAISDNNEGNPLGAFTYYFSTGDAVDTMEVSGHVIDAETLAPVKGVLVGLYVGDAPNDSLFTADAASDAPDAFSTRAFDRVARTDQEGRFSIKGVPQGTYRLFALKDVDGDYHFSSRAEMMGWTPQPFTTACYPDVRQDTVWRDTLTWDSIRVVPYTHFTPDNVVLRAFTHANRPRHLLKTQRDVPEWFRVYFTGPSAFTPQIQGLNFNEYNAFVEDRNATGDTITYWLRDTALLRLDTLSLCYTYYETDDSTGIDTLRTDTLNFVPRLTFAKRAKQQADELARWEKQRERRHKRGDYTDETPPREYLNVQVRGTGSSMAPNENPVIQLPQPAARFDRSGIHLLLGPDSAQVPARYELRPHPTSPLTYTLLAEWRPGQQYTLRIDSAAIAGLNGVENREVTQRFRISAAEEFGSLFVSVVGLDTTAVVQLLKDDKTVLQTARVQADGTASFFYLRPGKAYLRLFTDTNGNGRWDTGDYAARRQPEQMRYYPKQLDLRAGWDTEVTWQPDELPALRQKPDGLRSAASTQAKTRGAHERNIERQRSKK